MRLVIVAALIGCGVPHGPPSVHGEMLAVPPDPSPTGEESGFVRFRQTIISLGSRVPMKASGSQMDYELRRAGTTALQTRNSYELVAGTWKPIPAERLREQLTVVENGDVMRLTGPADKAAVVCQRQRVIGRILRDRRQRVGTSRDREGDRRNATRHRRRATVLPAFTDTLRVGPAVRSVRCLHDPTRARRVCCVAR